MTLDIQVNTYNQKLILHSNNRAVQAREGFAQKYPQAYENHKAINYHEGQTDQRRNQARNFRLEEKKLGEKHNLWATQMRKQGRHPV